MMVQDPFYIDFSKQLDNEIWYTTFDNKKLEKNSSLPDSVFFTGGWGNLIYSLLTIHMKMEQEK